MFSVGDRVVYNGRENSLIMFGQSGTIDYIESCEGTYVNWDDGQKTWVFQENLKLAEPAPMQLDLKDTKIDVQKYAEQYGLTLKQAHEEVQTWLFKQGHVWPVRDAVVQFEHAPYLYVYGRICFDEDRLRFGEHQNKEITLNRSAVVTITPEGLVEFMGKRYRKAELEATLPKLEEQK